MMQTGVVLIHPRIVIMSADVIGHLQITTVKEIAIQCIQALVLNLLLSLTHQFKIILFTIAQAVALVVPHVITQVSLTISFMEIPGGQPVLALLSHSLHQRELVRTLSQEMLFTAIATLCHFSLLVPLKTLALAHQTMANGIKTTLLMDRECTLPVIPTMREILSLRTTSRMTMASMVSLSKRPQMTQLLLKSPITQFSIMVPLE